MQFVTLLFVPKINIPHAEIRQRVEYLLGESVQSNMLKKANETFLILHTNHLVEYSDCSAPAQTILFPGKEKNIGTFENEIEQSWSFPDASKIVASAKFSLSLGEFMALGLDHNTRLKLFHGVLQASIELCKPIALVFTHSCQVISPVEYLKACNEHPKLRPGTLNVRLFKSSNSEGELIMDILGLDAIGLHDLQCHFCELDPNDVSRILFNTAVYIIDKGPIIESGQTIAGRSREEKWQCQFEESLLEPTREILDLNPGVPYAAGGRT